MIGTVLNDRYRIERRIGKGGFAEVYRAHDSRLKRDVAIKILLEMELGKEFRERFLRECESMAILNNPHIVTVHDFGEHNGRPFIVIELIEGISLLEMVQKYHPDMEEMLKIGGQVCRAMAFAHEHGIIHRDLTMKNIMINVDGDAKVLDFGLAKMVDTEMKTDRTDPAILMGTMHYLSPEQVTGQEIDTRADIFAFGVCMYRMVSGRFPFDAEHPGTLTYLIANEDPPPFEADVPTDLQEVVLKCLEKDRENRWSSFGELGETMTTMKQIYEHSKISMIAPMPVVASSLENRSSKRNPYLNRVMIKSAEDFINRNREVKRIYSRLDAPHPQSVAVVGDRRMGKSSLLNYVYMKSNRKEHMTNFGNAIFVFMDFQRGGDMDLPKFIDILFEMFRYEKHQIKALESGEKTLDTLRAAVEELNNQGKRLIVLMDEFDAITTNPNFDMQFFSFLRFLANNYKVAYVTSSLSDLQQMCYDKEISDSPFFNIFSNLPLRPFSRAAALELIKVPSEREGIPLEPYSDRILQMSGHLPYFIQVACSHVCESIVENDGGEPDWESVERSFGDECNPHFSFIWGRMEEAAKDNLSRVAHGKPVDRKLHHISEELRRKGYLEGDGGDSQIFSRSFKDFILEQDDAPKPKKGFLGGLLGRRK